MLSEEVDRLLAEVEELSEATGPPVTTSFSVQQQIQQEASLADGDAWVPSTADDNFKVG